MYSNDFSGLKGLLDTYDLISPEEKLAEELRTIQYFEDQGLLSHERAMKARGKAFTQYLNEYVSNAQNAVNQIQTLSNNLSGTVQNNQQAEEIAITTRYDKEIAAAEGNSDRQEKLEEEKQKEIRAIRAKYADKQFALQIAQITAQTAMAAMQVFSSTIDLFSFLGPLAVPIAVAAAAPAIVYGNSQIAVAKAQRDAAKAGYFKGGYTGGTNPREIRGYFPDGEPYHGGEFVATHKTVQILKPVFDIMDYAQRTGNTAALTGPDMALAIGGAPVKSYSAPSGQAVTANGNSAGYDENMILIMTGMVKTLDRLNRRLDEPFTGEVAITGQKGFEKVWNDYNKLIKNASR
jgi:hypothetical protein